MKLTMNKPVEVEAVAVRVVAPVRYDEEDMPSDYPHRNGDMWDVTIDIETGQIEDWPEGVPARGIYMKVVDGGSYYLLDPRGVELASIENNYVPDGFPGDHAGDYLIFKIDASGRITNWPDADIDDMAMAFGGD